MCTVSFVPTADGVYLTSNRDEWTGRRPALLPVRSGSGAREMLCPRDGAAGGSWISLKHNGDAAVLLNGAFVKHERMGDYRRSRGLVFLDIAGALDPVGAFEDVVLTGIEPFTLVLYSGGRLFECRWDGRERHVAELNADRPYIWSSATLYDAVAAASRRLQFEDWYADGVRIDGEAVVDFHRLMRMEEGNGMRGLHEEEKRIATVSITSIHIGAEGGLMQYFDLRTGKRFESGFGSRRRRSFEGLKRFFIRLGSWEYWPFGVLYFPVFFYWAWLSGKARSFFFFSTANPSITNAGFLMESKKEIYDLMPAGSYPETLYVPKGRPVVEVLGDLSLRGLPFPLIAKPDIGQRGMQVSLLRDECALYLYSARSKVDFLLQEYIDYPHEAGVFYYRRPGEAKGHVSGIVGKEMLAVKGDGVSTLEALLLGHDRYVLQLPALRAAYGKLLQQVPAAGEERLLVPYGNHSRGAKFLDWSDRLTPALEETIDAICRQIPGFHFGRLDVKFADWDEFCAGRRFSIIELNGAGSEPTHIYDPRHSVLYAWKEIIRHHRLLFDISRANARLLGLAPMSTAAGLAMFRDYARHEKLLL